MSVRSRIGKSSASIEESSYWLDSDPHEPQSQLEIAIEGLETMAINYTILEDEVEASQHVAGLFASMINRKPQCVLGLATGGTPVKVYSNLCRRFLAGEVAFEQVTTFNLDEYVGLPPGHEQSYRSFMNEQLFRHVDVPLEQTHFPDAGRLVINDGVVDSESANSIAADYEALIQATGGIDLQLLGIGTNGHIAFNEPGSTIDSMTRLVGLTESTIAANARFFEDASDVPRQAFTMGIATILRARKIVLMATGESKAEAVASAINGAVTSDNPASFLQTHSDTLFVLDKAAASAIA